MVRETRHLWVENLPENIHEYKIRAHFKKYGRVQCVMLRPQTNEGKGACAMVSFIDIKSATMALTSRHKLEGRKLTTDYYDPASNVPPPPPPPLYSQNFSRGSPSKEVNSRFEDKPGTSTSLPSPPPPPVYSHHLSQGQQESLCGDVTSQSSASSRGSHSDELPNSVTNLPAMSSDLQVSTRLLGPHHRYSPGPSSDGQRLAIRIKNLPPRSSDTCLKDGLFREYKKYAKVTSVKVVGYGPDRYAVVCFKKPEDAAKALEVSRGKKFYGCMIQVARCHGYEADNLSMPYVKDQDEYHPKASKVLFVGNLTKGITKADLHKLLDQFGEIIGIEIIHSFGGAYSYAFCEFSDISSVVRAIQALDGELLQDIRIKLGFGKTKSYNLSSCVWLEGVSELVTEEDLRETFIQFGSLTRVTIDHSLDQALILFKEPCSADLALRKMRGCVLQGRRLAMDMAGTDFQRLFYERLKKQNGTNATNERHADSESTSSVNQKSCTGYNDDGSVSNENESNKH